MYMKKVLFIAALVVAALPSMAQGLKYSVSGTYADEGKKVYLADQLTKKKIDSLVVAGGKFSFSGTADKDAYMAVMLEGNDWVTPFFNDGTPVIVNLNDSTLKGSALNERLTRYDLEGEVENRQLTKKLKSMTREQLEANADALMAEITKVQEIKTATANRVFKEERQSLIPLAFAHLYFLDNGVEAYDDLVKEQVPFASHPYLKKAMEDVAAVTKPDNGEKAAFIGQQFTDLEMADPDGKMHKISELVGEGKYVLVDFWASWCGPCRAEMPNVLEAYNKYHAKGFEVVGVSFDQKKDAWVKAVEQLKMPWLQISDLKGWSCAAAPIYKVDAIPDNILIDPQGKIIDRALRGKPLHKKLQRIFGE